ncbi:MAG TPA: hypothetical protein VG371_09755 [Solirubrobacteraceae bacterium]|jgi:hypothetical protein|nr:hypothetical protein [Solirubrobacteraceae bacterium]
MSVLTIVETVLLLIAIVYIVALLRSHADILRRLAVLEEGGVARMPTAPVRAGPSGRDVVSAEAISGATLDGDSVTLSFGAGSPVTLLAFLTSGCTSCAPLWAGLRDAAELESLAERVVVVTHDSTRESPSRVRRLAPAAAEVIMSTRAWEDYAVPSSPHFVLTDGGGGIRGRGTALSWSQLETMVDDAGEDAVPPAAARTTEERAARSEQTLARAGIGPGHPSLFPSAAGETEER